MTLWNFVPMGRDVKVSYNINMEMKKPIMLHYFYGEHRGWVSRVKSKRLSNDNQFVGQIGNPSTSLDSIRSEMISTISACVDTRLSRGKGHLPQTLQIKLLGGLT